MYNLSSKFNAFYTTCVVLPQVSQDELAILNDMVKAVNVHAPDKLSGHREQQIDISYVLAQ